jgi:hypothetical protein
MKKRILDLREATPLLDVVSYGRAGRRPTPAQWEHIARTVHRVPEVMVKVSGGARTLSGVERHMAYVGRNGEIGLETDMGSRADGKGFERDLIRDWDLDIEALERQSERAVRARRPAKLVHNIIFSMPPGTPPQKVLQAVRKLALNEWQLKHRYAMTLHNDDKHPHVHAVLKAMSEQGERMNIRKATLRSWRTQFAANLRELGVAANATERAVRGDTKTRKRDGIYRAAQRNESTHMKERRDRARSESLGHAGTMGDSGKATMRRTRQDVSEGWRRVSAVLDAAGDHELAAQVRSFAARMPSARTESELIADHWRARTQAPGVDPLDRTR